MERPSSPVERQTSPAPVQRQPSPLEISILRDCGKQVFFTKCIPATIGMLVVGEVLHNKGVIKMGRVGRFFGAGFFGVIGVRFANELTEGSCVRRVVREVPDGFVAKMMEHRARRNSPPGKEIQSDSILDKEMEMEQRRPPAELDDKFRPTVHDDYKQPVSDTESQSGSSRNTTYAELREQHQQRMRRERQIAQNNVPSPYWNPAEQKYVEPQKPSVWDTPQDPPAQKGKRNKYGDVWDE